MEPMVKPKHTPSDENSILIFPDKVSVPAQAEKVKWTFVIGNNTLRSTDIVVCHQRCRMCVYPIQKQPYSLPFAPCC